MITHVYVYMCIDVCVSCLTSLRVAHFYHMTIYGKLSAKLSVCYANPQAFLMKSTASKQMYKHGHIWSLSIYFGMRSSEWYNLISILYIERIAYMNTYIHVHIPIMYCARFSFYRAFWNNMFTTSLGYLGWYGSHHSEARAEGIAL